MGHQGRALPGRSGIEVTQKVDGHARKSHRPSGDALQEAVGVRVVAIRPGCGAPAFGRSVSGIRHRLENQDHLPLAQEGERQVVGLLYGATLFVAGTE